MSTAIEKLAQSNFTPPEILLLSALGGGSAFAGMRYLTDLSHKLNPPKPDQNKIKLQLPNPMSEKPQVETQMDPMGSSTPGIPKTAQEGPEWWLPWAAGLAGAPIGFLGAKSMYDQYQEMQGNNQIADAKKKYTQQLLMAQQMNKGASETPLIDQFCKEAAEQLEKKAGAITDFISKHPKTTAGAGLGALGTANHFAGDIGETMAYHKPEMWGMSPPALGTSRQDIMDILPKDSLNNELDIKNRMADNAGSSAYTLANKATGGLVHGAADTWAGLLGAGALSTLGLLLHNHGKKKEKEQRANYPTGVEYAQ